MKWHRRVLQQLQYTRRMRQQGFASTGAGGGAGANAAAGTGEADSHREHEEHHLGQRWLLKTPYYIGLIEDVVREYPDAIIIQTHRPPADVIASSASVHAR
jgi:hypothetical protein